MRRTKNISKQFILSSRPANQLMIIFSLLFCLSMAHTARGSEQLAAQAYSKLTWLGDKPLKTEFTHIYGHTATLNRDLEAKLRRGQYAKVINVYDHALRKAGLPVLPNRILRGKELGVPTEVTRRISVLDELLVHSARKDSEKPAIEILQFRIHSPNKVIMVKDIRGHSKGTRFSYNEIIGRLSKKIEELSLSGSRAIKLEIIHNHPIQAIEFFDREKKSLGYYYNPFSQHDIDVGQRFQKEFPDIPVELAIVVGLKKEDLFRVSYYPNSRY